MQQGPSSVTPCKKDLFKNQWISSGCSTGLVDAINEYATRTNWFITTWSTNASHAIKISNDATIKLKEN